MLEPFILLKEKSVEPNQQERKQQENVEQNFSKIVRGIEKPQTKINNCNAADGR